MTFSLLCAERESCSSCWDVKMDFAQALGTGPSLGKVGAGYRVLVQ